MPGEGRRGNLNHAAVRESEWHIDTSKWNAVGVKADVQPVAGHAIPTMYSVREFAVAGGLDQLRNESDRDIPTGRTLHGSHSQGFEAHRPAGHTGHENSI